VFVCCGGCSVTDNPTTQPNTMTRQPSVTGSVTEPSLTYTHICSNHLSFPAQVFIVFFQAAYIEQKLKRICDAFGATQFDVPDLEHTAEIQVSDRR
jgi:hypothetical protein